MCAWSTNGSSNTADGYRALYSNTTGQLNTACGNQALKSNTTGTGNTACGNDALLNLTGASSGNIAIGWGAGSGIVTGQSNICIGHPGGDLASGRIFIGDKTVHSACYIGAGECNISGTCYFPGVYAPDAVGRAVWVNSNGLLGTPPSSRRFKKDISDMAAASEALLALRPVSFRYKPEVDSENVPQFGLIAEEVAEVSADLVGRDAKGEIRTVRYEAINAMLLNEFLKQHKRVQEQARINEEQAGKIDELQEEAGRNKEQARTLAAQQQQIKALTERLDEMSRRMEHLPAQPAPDIALP